MNGISGILKERTSVYKLLLSATLNPLTLGAISIALMSDINELFSSLPNPSWFDYLVVFILPVIASVILILIFLSLTKKLDLRFPFLLSYFTSSLTIILFKWMIMQ